MGDINVSSGLGEIGKRVREIEEQLNLAVGQWFDVLVRSVSYLRKLLQRRTLRRVMDIALLNVQHHL